MSNLPTNKRKGDHLTAEEWNAMAAVVNELSASSYVKPEQGIPKEDLSESVQDDLDKASVSYSKPASGIPKSDLSSQVQESLDAADSAYQKPLTGIPSTDFSEEVTESLSKADSSLQTITIGETITGEAGTDAEVDNIGTINDPILQFTIPRGLNGTNGIDAINSFKGWYTSSGNLPANPVKGDFAYVKGATVSDPVIIYECNTEGTWSDSGRTFNPANNQEFETGEKLNETKIDNTKLINPSDNSIPKAVDVMQLNVKLSGVDCTETKMSVITSGEGQNVFSGRVVGADGSISASNYYSYYQIELSEGTKSVRFRTVNGSGWTCGYAFGNIVEGNFVVTRSSTFPNTKDTIVEVKDGETAFRTTCRISTTTYPNYLKLEDFYCYLQTGSTVIDLINATKVNPINVNEKFKTSGLDVVTLEFVEKAVMNNEFEPEFVDMTKVALFPYAITSSGVYSSSATTKHGIVFCRPGDIIHVRCGAVNAVLGFVTEDNISTSGGAISLVPNTNVQLVKGEIYYEVPDGANLLLFRGDGDYLPSEITLYHNLNYDPSTFVPFAINRVNVNSVNGYVSSGYSRGIAFYIPKGYAGQCATDCASNNNKKHLYSSGCTFNDASVADGVYAANKTTIAYYARTSYRYVIWTFYSSPVAVITPLTPVFTKLGSYFKTAESPDYGAWVDSNNRYLESIMDNAPFQEFDLSLYPTGLAIHNTAGHYLGSTPSKVVPIKPRHIYKIIANDTNTCRFAFLTQDDLSAVEYDRPSYCVGTGRFNYAAGGTYYFVSPNDASYISIYMGASGSYAPVYFGEYVVEGEGTADNSTYLYIKSNFKGQKAQEAALVTQTDIGNTGNDSSGYANPKTLQELNLIKKTKQFNFIKWTPKSTFYGKTITDTHKYEAGVQQTSIPYSNNYDDYKQVGQTVSIHTFMTAVNNPYSLLYTERVSEDNSQSIWGRTYYGPNGNSYYGTVCCMFASYVDGYKGYIGNNKWTGLAARFGVTTMKFNRGEFDPQLLRVGDVLDNAKHSVVITGLKKDTSGNVTHVRWAQSSGSSYHGGCQIFRYTLTQFKNMMPYGDGTNPYAIFSLVDFARNTEFTNYPEYVDIDDDPEQTITNAQPTTMASYNDDICTIYGDKASLAEGYRVVLNYNLNGTPVYTWTAIEVYKDDILVDTYQLSSIDQSLLPEGQRNHALDLGDSLTAGMYKARMTDGTNYSDYTYWEIISNNVTIEKIEDGIYKVTNNTGKNILECAIGGYVQGETLGMKRLSSSLIYPLSRQQLSNNYFNLYLKDFLEDFSLSTDLNLNKKVLKIVVQGEYTAVATACLFLPDIDYGLTRGGAKGARFVAHDTDLDIDNDGE